MSAEWTYEYGSAPDGRNPRKKCNIVFMLILCRCFAFFFPPLPWLTMTHLNAAESAVEKALAYLWPLLLLLLHPGSDK